MEEQKIFGVPDNCPSGSFYTVSQGYRRVPGNTCFGGQNMEPMKFPCPSNGFFNFTSVLIVLGALGLCCIAYKMCSKEKIAKHAEIAKAKFERKSSSPNGAGSSAKYGNIEQLPSGLEDDEDDDFDGTPLQI